ncbi:hypothetical protein G6Z92_18620 [Vibrio aestuarianus subsp. cardii]|uniref:hypothetical protein n=1 Tax=Vibrio aestuarianus TaxID=28171 RepID=UPI0015C56BCA|nr:hypothetical protein [Vibrio aestuarianus]NGZ68931.1 hypothetical protein [Vibrio aestuarianus subsp. cardii]
MFDWNIALFQLGMFIGALVKVAKSKRAHKVFAFHLFELGKASYTGAFVTAVLDNLRWECFALLLLGIAFTVVAEWIKPT